MEEKGVIKSVFNEMKEDQSVIKTLKNADNDFVVHLS